MSKTPLKIDKRCQKAISANIHEGIHAEFVEMKRLHSLSSAEVISRGIQLLRIELAEVGKWEMMSRLKRGFTSTIKRSLARDVDAYYAREEEENGNN